MPKFWTKLLFTCPAVISERHPQENVKLLFTTCPAAVWTTAVISERHPQKNVKLLFTCPADVWTTAVISERHLHAGKYQVAVYLSSSDLKVLYALKGADILGQAAVNLSSCCLDNSCD